MENEKRLVKIHCSSGHEFELEGVDKNIIGAILRCPMVLDNGPCGAKIVWRKWKTDLTKE